MDSTLLARVKPNGDLLYPCSMDYSLLVQEPVRLLQEFWLRALRAPWRRAFSR